MAFAALLGAQSTTTLKIAALLGARSVKILEIATLLVLKSIGLFALQGYIFEIPGQHTLT